MRIVGLMSGTSLDGIDVACVDVDDASEKPAIELVAFATVPYERKLRDALRALSPPAPGSAAQVARLDVELGEKFAAAALELAREQGIAVDTVDLIGSHGHTLLHDPRGSPPSTLQIGSGDVIAARTGVTTVNDF